MNDFIFGARVSRGGLWIDGIEIHNSEVDAVELRRRASMVFGKSNPFPHILGERLKSVHYDNVEALRGSAMCNEVKSRLHESAHGISGGQQERLCNCAVDAGTNLVRRSTPSPPPGSRS
jgi:phosphate transport system ATP-binding protein